MDIVEHLMNLTPEEIEPDSEPVLEVPPKKKASSAHSKAVQPADDDIVEDDSFSYNGYQVVRGEFFAHVAEPSLSFNMGKLSVNSAALRKMPDVDYVQILVNSDTKKLVIRPSDEDAKDAFLWCTEKDGKRKPKYITCRVFFAKIVNLMEWHGDFRYKLLGKIIRSGDEKLIVFDLTASEMYRKIYREGAKPKSSRTPVFPAEWQNQFGLSVEEHSKLLQVNIFEGYTIFGIQENKPDEDAKENTPAEVKTDE